MRSVPDTAPRRGDELLLHHCSAVGRFDGDRLPPRERLEAAVGSQLTKMLLAALCTPRGRHVRPRFGDVFAL